VSGGTPTAPPVVPPPPLQARLLGHNPPGVILPGGPNSIHVEGSPRVPEGFFEWAAENKVPVLGICYGMQMLVHLLGGRVKVAEGKGEYGKMEVECEGSSELYGAALGGTQTVWMSHGDEADEAALPAGFAVVGKSKQGAIVAIEDPRRRFFGLQYHPEVMHSLRGKETIRRFLFDTCGLRGDWSMKNVLEEQLNIIRQQVGPEDHAICALSGGVDSCVAAKLVHQVLGDRLHCVFVDNGLLRYKEAERVNQVFREKLHLPVTTVDAAERFLSKLAGNADPERKRKIIGAEFIAVFKDAAHEIEARLGTHPKFLIQGTLYPDVIESCPPPGQGKHSHTIKSHHNVGGLPEQLGFDLIEPLRELFKDEVRELGRLIGVPEEFITRHPFPGPGLAVRALGDVTTDGKLDVLRRADEIYVNCIREYGLYDEIWQAFAVFLPLKTVGVQGDQRTHSYVIGLRAVTSSDGMTADWYEFSGAFLRDVSTRICNQIREVNRVCYDITSKPPGTIEWE